MSKKDQNVADVETEVTEAGPDLILLAFTDAKGGTDGVDEDDVKMAMIGAGATFKNVTRLFNEYMVVGGFAMTLETKRELVATSIDGLEISGEEGFSAAVDAIVENGTNVSAASAGALIRAHAKKNELEVYAKPAGEGGTRNPFVPNFHAALVENPTMGEDGLRAVIAELSEEHQVNPNRWFNQQNSIRKMVNAVAAKLAA